MNNDMRITFPGGKRVNAEYGGFEVKTDQPVSGGGDGSAPEPYLLFLASLGTCAGIYVLGFCNQRKISTDGIQLVQRMISRDGGGIGKIEIDIQVPPEFPEKYHKSLVRAANLCAVKKTMFDPPEFQIETVVG